MPGAAALAVPPGLLLQKQQQQQQHRNRSSSLHRQQPQRQQPPTDMSELNLFSLLWRRDTQSLQELLDCYELAESNRSVLVSVRCLREHCSCTLNNQEVLMLRAVRDAKLVSGSWNKAKAGPHPASIKGAAASPAASNGEKSIKVILTDYSSGWFEVLNENGASIPYWAAVKDVARHRPQSIFLRKDQKCLFARNKSGNGSLELSAESTGILKAGTVLSYIESGKFRVQKHRKVKELPLVKCADSNGHLVFLSLDDKCAVSPVAGAENISGVHTLPSLLSKFQFPISVRPVFGPPLPWLSYSDRYNLRLTTCSRGDLLFLASLSNPERFFVVTPEMLEQHAFRVGESELGHHVQLLEKHSTRVTQFLQSYHPFEALRYLLRHLQDATNCLAPPERNCPLPGEPQAPLPLHQQPEPLDDVDDLLDEVEDIYFYVRTGRMPVHSHVQQQQQQHSKSNSSNDSGLVLVNPRARHAECLGVPAAPRPFRATSCEDLLEGRSHQQQQQQLGQQYQSYYPQQQQQPQQQGIQRPHGPPPPLPPRKYTGSTSVAAPGGSGSGPNYSPAANRQPPPPHQRGCCPPVDSIESLRPQSSAGGVNAGALIGNDLSVSSAAAQAQGSSGPLPRHVVMATSSRSSAHALQMFPAMSASSRSSSNGGFL